MKYVELNFFSAYADCLVLLIKVATVQITVE